MTRPRKLSCNQRDASYHYQLSTLSFSGGAQFLKAQTSKDQEYKESGGAYNPIQE